MRPLNNEEYENFHKHVKCNWIECAYGLGLAGRGDCCAGDWTQKDCPEFVTIVNLEADWRKNDTH